MSKTVHPYAHRLVILRDWKSRWFASDKKYADLFRGDVLIRAFIEKKLRGSYVAGVEIERSRKFTRIIIRTSRPGMIIGRNGEGAIKLREALNRMMKKQKIEVAGELKIDIAEVQSPESDAHIVAFMVVEGLEKRLPFRRVLKQTVEKVMGVRGVKGVRILIGGRLGGAEIARTEELKKGSIPLQTFRADIDFSRERAVLPYGTIGVKVWIYRGEIFAAEAKKTNKE